MQRLREHFEHHAEIAADPGRIVPGNGRTRMTKLYMDGSRYEGEVGVTNERRCGFGVFVNRNGERYAGQWDDDKRHGVGQYTWANGDTYYGQWMVCICDT